MLQNSFNTTLINLAAHKQLELARISELCECNNAQINVAIANICKLHRLAVDAGFSVQDLDHALGAIESAALLLNNLSVVTEPLTKASKRPAEQLLSKVMYPCGPFVEKTNHGAFCQSMQKS